MEQRSQKTGTKDDVESLPLINCSVVRAEPSLTAEMFEQKTKGAESVVIVTFASGTVPDRLASAIKSKLEFGIPVFLVSNNPGDTTGITKLKYQVQVNIANAGAIALERVNINNIEDVVRAIQEETANGKKGADLHKL